MSNPKFPSEEQGGYDPMQKSPQPLSPGRMTVHPDNEPDIDELPDDEALLELDEDDDAASDADVA